MLTPSPARPAIRPSATSPATRPTPTTDIGPFWSRGPEPNAAWAIPTIFCGMRRITPAVWPTAVPTIPGTAVTGWRTSSSVGEKPMKPTRSVRTVPAASSTGLPWSSTIGTLVKIGVAVRASRFPSRSTTSGSVRSPLGRTTARTWSHVLTGVPPMDRMRSPGRMPAWFAGATGSPALHATGVGRADGLHGDALRDGADLRGQLPACRTSWRRR